MQPCQQAFKSPQLIDTCTLHFDEPGQRLVFELTCKHGTFTLARMLLDLTRVGVKKKFRLTTEDCQAMQAVYSKDHATSRATIRPKLLSDCVANFHTGVEEIVMVSSPSLLRFKTSFSEPSHAKPAVLQTEIKLQPEDLENYQVPEETEISFNLREFKAIVALCEVIDQSVMLFFDKPGAPFLLSLRWFNAIEADFVLATLCDESSVRDSSQNATPNQSVGTASRSEHIKADPDLATPVDRHSSAKRYDYPSPAQQAKNSRGSSSSAPAPRPGNSAGARISNPQVKSVTPHPPVDFDEDGDVPMKMEAGSLPDEVPSSPPIESTKRLRLTDTEDDFDFFLPVSGKPAE